MIRVWLTSFIVLFGTAELFQWAQDLTLPMPIFVIGGALLAIASNYPQSKHPLQLNDSQPEPPKIPASEAPQVIITATPKARCDRPISFEIHKPFKPGD